MLLEQPDSGRIIAVVAVGRDRLIDEVKTVDNHREVLRSARARREAWKEPEADLPAEIVERQRIRGGEIRIDCERRRPEELLRCLGERGQGSGFDGGFLRYRASAAATPPTSSSSDPSIQT